MGTICHDYLWQAWKIRGVLLQSACQGDTATSGKQVHCAEKKQARFWGQDFRDDTRGFPGGSEVKASASNAGDPGLIPGQGRSLGEGNGNPLQYSCLENPMDGEAQQVTVHGVTKSRTRLSDFTFTLRDILTNTYR